MRDLKELPHLVLNGSQTLPNVLPMLELGARGYLVVFTRDQPVAPLRRACASFGVEELLALEVPPYDVSGIVKRLTRELPKIRRVLEGGKLVANLTGGTKPMVLGAARGVPDALVQASLYLDRQTLLRVSGGDPVPTRMQRELSVTELLQAHAIPVRRKGVHGLVHRLAAPPDAASIAVARVIARNTNRLRLPLGKLRAGQRAPTKGAVSKLLEAFRPERSDGSAPGGTARAWLDSDPVGFANGKWLEIYVWDLLRREAERCGITDVQHSVDLLEMDESGERPTTDLDVAFARGASLGFVSCKTGTAEELKDEVFRVAARQRQVGGTFGRGVLLHWHPPNDAHVRKAAQAAKQLGVRVLGREVLHDEQRLCRELVSGG